MSGLPGRGRAAWSVPRNGRHLGRSGSPSPSRGKARGGPGSRTSCASRARGSGLRESRPVLGNGGVLGSAGCPPGPRWAREGCASIRRRWSLQPARPRARDRRCPGEADRGNGQPSTRSSRAAGTVDFLCGESRSGPDPSKLGLHGVRKEGHAAGYAVRMGPNPEGHLASTRFSSDPGLCSWIELVAESVAAPGDASRERAAPGTSAMEGALG